MTGELKVAVLGVGKMGSFHVESLSRRTRGARVTVVSDFSDEQAHRVADPIGARVVADPLAAIAADDVDAVVIASPGRRTRSRSWPASRPASPCCARSR